VGIGTLTLVGTFLGSLVQAVKAEDYIATDAHHIRKHSGSLKAISLRTGGPLFIPMYSWNSYDSWMFVTYCS
jgi:hypothetical protein